MWHGVAPQRTSTYTDLIILWCLERNALPAVRVGPAGIWPAPGDLYFFIFSVVISNSKSLLSTEGPAACNPVCLMSLTPPIHNSWQHYEWFFILFKTLMVSTTKITILIFYQIRSRSVNLLKLIYAYVQVSDMYFFSCLFQVYYSCLPNPLPPFVPETSATFTSYSVHFMDSATNSD